MGGTVYTTLTNVHLYLDLSFSRIEPRHEAIQLYRSTASIEIADCCMLLLAQHTH
jgi:hypothetical protein